MRVTSTREVRPLHFGLDEIIFAVPFKVNLVGLKLLFYLFIHPFIQSASYANLISNGQYYRSKSAKIMHAFSNTTRVL